MVAISGSHHDDDTKATDSGAGLALALLTLALAWGGGVFRHGSPEGSDEQSARLTIILQIYIISSSVATFVIPPSLLGTFPFLLSRYSPEIEAP